MLIPICFLVLAAGISAQPLPAGRPARSAQRVVVTPEGAFYSGRARPLRPHGPLPLQTAGTLWTHTDGGLVWIGNALALGNHGSEVFCEYDLNNERAELFSAFDSDPPTALWSDLSAQGSDDHHVASAETSDVQVALHTFNQGQPGASCVLSKYSSLSSVPDWTYTFPIAPNGGTNVGISRDGQTIVAAASDLSNSNVEIAVFGPGSNVPVSYTTYPLGGTNNCIRGFDLSADGSTLYFSSAGTPVAANIFDVPSATVVFNTLINASFDSHGISGDGSVFAFGNFGLLQVWQKVAGYYINTITHFVPGANYCGYLDVSDDGSTVACGFTFYIGYQQVEIDAIDVPTMSVTMSDVFSSANPLLQNIVSGVSVSADGQRFAVGLWGDGSGPLAEARLYSKNQNAPLATINLTGSVFGLQISADGQRAAFGSKAVHANQLGNGGRISLLGDSTPFTHFCAGDGSLATACPCANSGLIGRGCENSSTTGGALLTAQGAVSPDSVVLTASGELASALSMVFQGSVDNSNGVVFGDGVRCAGGTLKRLYLKSAVGGTVIAPAPGDPALQAQSAAKGDPITPGQTRSYQVYYHDPVVGFCSAPGNAWNVTNAVRVSW